MSLSFLTILIGRVFTSVVVPSASVHKYFEVVRTVGYISYNSLGAIFKLYNWSPLPDLDAIKGTIPAMTWKNYGMKC